MELKKKIQPFDARRDIVVPGNLEETISFCASQFVEIGNKAIQSRGAYYVALSGGSTPHAIFHELSQVPYRTALDWSQVVCFWSDERSFPPEGPENNYFSGMKAGLEKLPLKKGNIFRMMAEEEIEKNALAYETLIREKVPFLQFDLIMLGMGKDGHTASLFPYTKGLHTEDRLIIANQVPQLKTWRMSMSYTCIHLANHISIYTLGGKKAKTVATVLQGPYDPEKYPIQKIGTPTHKALWILDTESARDLNLN